MESSIENVQYKFGPFHLDLTNRSLLRGRKVVPLPPKALGLLIVLVEHRGHTVEKERLLETIWPDVFVEESSLTQLVFQLRKALGENKYGPQYIETIPKRGYRFAADVGVVRNGSEILLTSRSEARVVIEEEEEDGAERSTAPGHRSDLSVEETQGRARPVETLGGSVRVIERVATSVAPARVSALPREISSGRNRALVALAALFGLSILTLLIFQYTGEHRALSKVALPFQKMNYRKLTSSGRAMFPAISPDGGYVAYVQEEEGQLGLWVRQVATTSRVQIVPPADLEYLGLTFSPDGQFIYYVVSEKGQMTGVLNQVPVFGGTVRRVMTGVDSPISFSPDGRRFAFMRGGQLQGETALILANADGTGEQRLTTRKRPDYYSTSGLTWSPDGYVVACGAGKSDAQNSYAQVVTVLVSDGKEVPLGSQTWAFVGQVAWLRDGGGVVVQAWPQDAPIFADQLWYLSYPGGETQRVTRDLISYEGVSVANRADVLVTWRSDRVSHIWVAPHASAGEAKQIGSGTGDNYGEVLGLDWTPDGRVVLSSHCSGNTDIWSMNADGSSQQQLTFDPRRESWPVVSTDGRYIVFTSLGLDGVHLWRMDSDGNNRRQLTHGQGESFPGLSPDGKWVFFTSMELGRPAVAKVSIEGGDMELFTKHPSGRPVVSPDGKWIACLYLDEQVKQSKVAVFRLSGGAPVKILEDMPAPEWDVVQWTPDSRAVTFVATRQGVSNIWIQPISGGPPLELTHFKEDRIYRFAWSRDGQNLALDRGINLNDIILITDFR